jgi:uncharacterized protein (DUF1800 family)
MARLDPAEAWRPWEPDARNPWNLKWAGHLFRRAAFGASWDELQAAVREGLRPTLDRLLAGGPGHAEFDRLADALGPERGEADGDVSGLEWWWLQRMARTPHPLRERMTLFWHDHFATSIAKVRQPALMKRQNVLLRRHALGRFRPFLLEVSRDPAMLIWLDGNSNVRGRPNENYARELLELFSLGVGNYTERDVREAARAFTGWHTTSGTPLSSGERGRGEGAQPPEFVFRAYLHDAGDKTFLGRPGNWGGADVVRIALDQPAAARFLVRKVYRHFVSEDAAPPDRLLAPLAERFRNSDYDIAELMRTVLGSRHFFSEHAYRQRVKSPVDHLVGLLRSLGGDLSGAAADVPPALEGLGQRLFAPPTVRGWEGGRAWLNTATLLARHNLSWRLLQGPPEPLAAGIDPGALARRHAGGNGYEQQSDFLLRLLLQPGEGEADGAGPRLTAYLSRGNPRGAALDARLREATHAVAMMPLYLLA